MTARSRAVLLIVNPVSGGKPGSTPPLSDDSRELEPEALADALRSRGLSVRLHVLTEDDDPGEVARDAQLDEDVVVAGGDGSVGPVDGHRPSPSASAHTMAWASPWWPMRIPPTASLTSPSSAG